MMVALKSGCQSDAVFWAAVAELKQSVAEPQQSVAELKQSVAEPRQSVAKQAASDSEGSAAGGSAEAPKKRPGPKPLAERTPEQQAAHAAKKALKAAEKQASAASSDAEAPKKRAPKALAEQGGGAAAAPAKQNAWLALVADTVKHMGAHGWFAWTDAKGVVWPGSQLNAEGEHVYASGPHAGKGPSNQRGGMSRASYVRANAMGLQGEWAEMEKA